MTFSIVARSDDGRSWGVAAVLTLQGTLAAKVTARLASLGHTDLRQWMDIENYERRFVDGGIDPVVLDRLRESTPAVQVEL